VYGLLRPFLFALDPERAHDLTLASLDRIAAAHLSTLLGARQVQDPVEVMGLRFANRVGLAAGLDKNAAHLRAMGSLGFGFLEVGTVTPRPQPGNAKPRLFRIAQRQALINRFGFNNEGIEHFIANVRAARFDGVLGLNIGKNASTPIEQALDDYVQCLEAVYEHASYVTVNISSPNTRNLRQLQGHDELDSLLRGLSQARARLADRHGRHVPMALKIAPDLDDTQIDTIAQRLVHHGIDAVIATNTTLSREAVQGLAHAEEAGGLSGAPVFEASNKVIRSLRARLPRDYPIIGVGGIMSADDARAKLDAGATLVQLYTGLVYRGPALIAECAQALADAARSQSTNAR
jgi:dihydroorotate dehydrogenase